MLFSKVPISRGQSFVEGDKGQAHFRLVIFLITFISAHLVNSQTNYANPKASTYVDRDGWKLNIIYDLLV